jgi:hypothetical protein
MAGEGSGASAASAVAAPWSPSKQVLWIGRALMWAYGAALWVLVVQFAFAAEDDLAVFLVAAGSLVASVAVHEVGHYIAARRAGMAVLLMRIFTLEVVPRRRGWAFRFKRYAHRMPAGLVIALPSMTRPWRPGYMGFALGGVLGNIVLLALLAAVFPFARDEDGRALVLLACCIAAMPLANLFPFKVGIDSDGIIAWRWWRHPPQEAAYAGLRAMAKVIAGVRTVDLTPDDIRALDAMSPMHAVWYAVKADQERGAWSVAAGRLGAWEQAVPTDPRLCSAFSELTEQTRWEIAFAAAIAARDPSLLPDAKALRAARWANPGLDPRCRAVVAWLDDDHNALAVATIEAMALADERIDRSLKESERLIGEALAATPLEPDAS